MKRVGLTILLNGLHHLKHNNYYQYLSSVLDFWVIVEGVSSPNGSTSWCKNLDASFHNNFLSKDGTTEFLDNNPKSNVVVVRNNTSPWKSKDEQVNAGINIIKTQYSECFLWQIDIDEQWSLQKFMLAENLMDVHKAKTGLFVCNYFVGKNQQVFGEWGENTREPYRRLWKWKGEEFKTHEPPLLNGKNGPGYLLPIRFNHFSYFFEEDVLFKEQYYGGYEGLHERWLKIQSNRSIIPVKYLLGPNIQWSYSNSYIKYIPNEITS